MKKILYFSLILAAGLTACNDDYVDQFNIEYEPTDVKNMNFTLEDADYAAISSLETNKDIALAKDPEGQTFLKALSDVAKNKYFNENAPAEEYIPAFIASKFPAATIGSRYNVTYNVYQTPSGYLKDFDNLKSYTFTEEDYKTIWKEQVTANFLSPSTVSKVSTILKENLHGAEGDVAVVNYAYSDVEPSIGGGGAQQEVIDKIADAAEGTEMTVMGKIIATYGRGFLINDGSGTILVYLNTTPNFSAGDEVKVSGKVIKYSGLLQFPQESVVTFVKRTDSFKYPTSAPEIKGADLDAYVKNPSIKYATLKGKLSISKDFRYYNIFVDGASGKGSISYPAAGLVDPALNGKEIVATGYMIGGSSKYINMMATSVVAQGAAVEYTPIGVVALSKPGNYTVKGSVIGLYDRGFLLNDGTANILIYKSGTGVKFGDIVTVKGETTSYAGFNQYKECEVTVISEGKYFAPQPTEMTLESLLAYKEAPYIGLVTYQGTLKDSGKFINVIIDGTSDVEGSIQYPIEGSFDRKGLNGKKIQVTGYALGVSGGKFINTMITKVEEAKSSKMMISRGLSRAAEVSANTSVLYRLTKDGWKEYRNNTARVIVLPQAAYDAAGSSVIADAENMLPSYLNVTYPIAKDGEKMAVVYNKSKDKTAVMEFTRKSGAWAMTSKTMSQTTTFLMDDKGISANMSIFLDCPFTDGAGDGSFVPYDVNLTGGLAAVWQLDDKYGWKASAYKGNKLESESWLVSPTMNFKKATAPQLVLEVALNKMVTTAKPEDHINIYVSKDFTGDVKSCTWDLLEYKLKEGADGYGITWTFFQTDLMDLTQYKGETNVVIGFCYKSTTESAPTFEMKNLKVAELSEFEK